ncbi:hypothetical protein BH11BAC4_BH11BAC4_24090 [soil metagenome]
MTMKEFDKLSSELDKAVLDPPKHLDLVKIRQEALASLKAVDLEMAMLGMDASFKKVDMEKIMAEATAELKHMDVDKLNEEAKVSLANAHKEPEHTLAELKKINKDAIRQQLAQVRMEVEKGRRQ